MLVLSVVVTFGVKSEFELCSACGSYRRTVERGLGTRQRHVVPVWPRFVEIEESEVSRAVLGPRHQHAWEMLTFGRSGFLGAIGHGGASLPRRFGGWYNRDPAFRAWVQSEIDIERLTRERFLMLLAVPSDSESTWVEQRHAPLVSEIEALHERFRSETADE